MTKVRLIAGPARRPGMVFDARATVVVAGGPFASLPAGSSPAALEGVAVGGPVAGGGADWACCCALAAKLVTRRGPGGLAGGSNAVLVGITGVVGAGCGTAKLAGCSGGSTG